MLNEELYLFKEVGEGSRSVCRGFSMWISRVIDSSSVERVVVGRVMWILRRGLGG